MPRSTRRWRVLATRSANSVAGYAQRYCSADGEELRWSTLNGARAYAKHQNNQTFSDNLHYEAEEIT